jgi:plasmid stabilization system protein ParE
MTFTLSFSKESQQNLRDIFKFALINFGEEIRQKDFHKLNNAIRTIQTFPNIGQRLLTELKKLE